MLKYLKGSISFDFTDLVILFYIYNCILQWNKFIYDTKKRNIAIVMAVIEFLWICPINYILDNQQCILVAYLWYFRSVCMFISILYTENVLTHLQNGIESRLKKLNYDNKKNHQMCSSKLVSIITTSTSSFEMYFL